MIFFDLKQSNEDAHQKFLELSKIYHPDYNSDKEFSNKMLQIVTDEYNEFRIIKKRWKEIEIAINQQSKVLQYFNLIIDNKDNIASLIKSIQPIKNKKGE